MTRSKLATLFVVVMVLVFPALSGAAGQTTVTSVYTVDGRRLGIQHRSGAHRRDVGYRNGHRSGPCLSEQFLSRPERRRLV